FTSCCFSSRLSGDGLYQRHGRFFPQRGRLSSRISIFGCPPLGIHSTRFSSSHISLSSSFCPLFKSLPGSCCPRPWVRGFPGSPESWAAIRQRAVCTLSV